MATSRARSWTASSRSSSPPWTPTTPDLRWVVVLSLVYEDPSRVHSISWCTGEHLPPRKTSQKYSCDDFWFVSLCITHVMTSCSWVYFLLMWWLLVREFLYFLLICYLVRESVFLTHVMTSCSWVSVWLMWWHFVGPVFVFSWPDLRGIVLGDFFFYWWKFDIRRHI